MTSALWNATTRAVEVSAYVPVIETDGTCTLTLTSGTATARADGKAFADASSTSCGLLSIAGSELKAGTWQATVAYDSPHTHGVSHAQGVTVP